MTDHGTVIVGASQAGAQLAISLREAGDTAPVTVIGAEHHPPYQRPPLSKTFLRGSGTASTLALRAQQFFDGRSIEVVTARRVIDVRRDGHGGVALTSDGTSFSFSRLALATGARARRLVVEGSHLDGIHYLRDVDDAGRLAVALSAATSVVVVGGGFIGLEVAATARARGCRTTVVESGDRILARALVPTVSDVLLREHRTCGTQVELGASVASFDGDDRVAGVVLTDGRRLPADLVVVGIGSVPRTELAEAMGLECLDGVCVDEFATSSDGVTVAAGDCAQMPNPTPGSSGTTRIESVNNAVEQAKVAALTLLGRPQRHRMWPWFWSDQGDLKLQMVGDHVSADECIVRGDPQGEGLSVLMYRAGQLIGAQCLNRAADFVAVRHALANSLTVPPIAARDSSVRLRTAAVPADAVVSP